MKDLFKEVEPGQLILATSAFTLKGKAKYVFEMLRLLATTEILNSDTYWWSVRADILARGRDLQPCPEVSLRYN